MSLLGSWRRRLAATLIVIGTGATAMLATGGAAAAATAPHAPPAPVNPATLLQKLPPPPAQISKSSPPVLGKQAIPLVKVNQNGTLDFNAPSPAGCRFQPSAKGGTPGTIQNAHPSTSVPGAIKVNSYIVCNYPVEALANETNLYKFGFFGLIEELQATNPTYNFGQAVLPNLGTYRRCTNTDSTTWTGDAYGISEENGVLYEGYGKSPGNTTWPCGT